ncbi:hypothetical protein AB2010_001507 [Citrobacter freundii]
MTIVYIPPLIALLVAKEKEVSRPLTRQEIEYIRDNATSIALPEDVAEAMAGERGYPDIDPEKAWEEWLAFR